MRWLLFAGCLGALSAAAAGPGFAQPQAGVVQVDARAEVAAALYAASATQAAAERAADARLRTQAAEIERLRREGRASRAEIAALEERYVADLAARDRAYAQEIAVFRAAVEDIAATPEGAAALARFNAGDEIGALAVLDQLRAARDRARQVRANLESAAEARRIATLALEARARGRLDTQAVIARYEEVTRLDPGMHWDWLELSQLHQDAGILPDARRAAEQAFATARNDRDRYSAMILVGDVLVDLGDATAARRQYETALVVARRVASTESSNEQTQADIESIQGRIGDILIDQGDLAGALQVFETNVTGARRRAEAHPQEARTWYHLMASLVALGHARALQGDLTGALTSFEEAYTISQQLVARDSVRIEFLSAIDRSPSWRPGARLVHRDLHC